MNIEYFNRIHEVYGLGVDEFLDLFAAQQHSCAICSCSLVLFSSHRPEQPVVDHDHLTGAVRGILCFQCNVALGWVEKNPERTVMCVAYLEGSRKLEPKRPRPTKQEASSMTREDWVAFRRDNKSPSRSAQVAILKAAKEGKLKRP